MKFLEYCIMNELHKYKVITYLYCFVNQLKWPFVRFHGIHILRWPLQISFQSLFKVSTAVEVMETPNFRYMFTKYRNKSGKKPRRLKQYRYDFVFQPKSHTAHAMSLEAQYHSYTIYQDFISKSLQTKVYFPKSKSPLNPKNKFG